MNINSQTKLIGLLGQPVKQSFSPSIHNYLSQKYNKNNIYLCFEVEKNNLKEAVEGIKSLKLKGCNVTIPYKVDIIKYLDEVDQNAKLIGAVNTVKNVDGKLIGYNTDGVGFVKSLLDNDIDLNDKKIMILGAGGACRSIAVELATKNVSTIEIRNRSSKNAEEIVNLINTNFKTKAIYNTNLVKEEDLKNIDILINTTPIGMNSNESPVSLDIKPPINLIVCDIVYKPHETRLLTWAKENKLKIIHGINMLINQGLLAYQIWEGIKTEQEDVDNIKKIYFESIK